MRLRTRSACPSRTGASTPYRPGAVLLALALAAGVAAASPAEAGRLDEAAMRICVAQGLKPGTAEYDRCYQEQLIILSGKAADSIHGSP